MEYIILLQHSVYHPVVNGLAESVQYTLYRVRYKLYTYGGNEASPLSGIRQDSQHSTGRTM